LSRKVYKIGFTEYIFDDKGKNDMNEKQVVGSYSNLEEKINVISHAVGLFLSIVAFGLLLQRAVSEGGALLFISFTVYGLSLILLYSASTFYHYSKDIKTRAKLQIFDHCSIYVLIAGTYTPYMLLTLNGSLGWTIFILIWALALIGIVLKLFFTGRFNFILTIMYILMGWMIVFTIKPLLNSLAREAVILLFAGGLAYTFGALIYGIKKIKLNHAIFHIFVLIGSLCHFISVYFYVAL